MNKEATGQPISRREMHRRMLLGAAGGAQGPGVLKYLADEAVVDL